MICNIHSFKEWSYLFFGLSDSILRRMTIDDRKQDECKEKEIQNFKIKNWVFKKKNNFFSFNSTISLFYVFSFISQHFDHLLSDLHQVALLDLFN